MIAGRPHPWAPRESPTAASGRPRRGLRPFSYISGWDLWKSTPARRALLQDQRFFQCCCLRCVSVDQCRRMICPACGDPSLLHHQTGQLSYMGQDPTRAPPGRPVPRPGTSSPFRGRCPKFALRRRHIYRGIHREGINVSNAYGLPLVLRHAKVLPSCFS